MSLETLPTAKHENYSADVLKAEANAAEDPSLELEGGAQAWCTVAGGYVALCILTLTLRIRLLTPFKVAGAFFHLWIFIVLWGVPGSVCSGWHWVFLKCQLDRFGAILLFRGDGSSCWTAPRQRVFQTGGFGRLGHIHLQVRSFVLQVQLNQSSRGNYTVFLCSL
jgi:hypothetical protein